MKRGLPRAIEDLLGHGKYEPESLATILLAEPAILQADIDWEWVHLAALIDNFLFETRGRMQRASKISALRPFQRMPLLVHLVREGKLTKHLPPTLCWGSSYSSYLVPAVGDAVARLSDDLREQLYLDFTEWESGHKPKPRDIAEQARAREEELNDWAKQVAMEHVRQSRRH